MLFYVTHTLSMGYLWKYLHAMNTTDFGWPMSFPVKTVGPTMFLLLRDLVLMAILMRQCKKGGYKQIEEMLKH